MDSECPSLCIPRVYNKITSSEIRVIFEEKLNIGKVKSIQILNTNSHMFKKAYIHFDLD